MLKPSDCIKYYSKQGFIDSFIKYSAGREVIPRYGEFFGKRPQVFNYKDELLSVVREGATSFHYSVERWINPINLSPDLKRIDLDSMRKGWDLILDIDCPILDYSRMCAKLLIDSLKFHGVREPSLKFSGNKGFHIGVSFESFPKSVGGRLVKEQFPDAPRIINEYLSEMIEDYLSEMILERDSIDEVSRLTSVPLNDLAPEGKLLPYRILDIDSIAISSRHLIRMPYSLHEKSGLVSLPLSYSNLDSFKREDASPDKVSFELSFLESVSDCNELFTQAFDWFKREKVKKTEAVTEFKIPDKALPESLFPPCIKSLLKGLPDGRKRALFVLINFLRNAGYPNDSVKKLISEWNRRNPESLRDSYVASQINWFNNQKDLLPPNCSNPNFYRDLRVCSPDHVCERIKNPLTYSLLKNKNLNEKPKKKVVNQNP